MKRKIAVLLAVLGVSLFLATPANAGPGDTVGWSSNNCNTTYGTIMNMNLKVYWSAGYNDRKVYVSGSDYYATAPHLYEGMDDIAVYAKAPGGTWVRKADFQPGPPYGGYDYTWIASENLANPGSAKYWQAHMRFAGQICYSNILYN